MISAVLQCVGLRLSRKPAEVRDFEGVRLTTSAGRNASRRGQTFDFHGAHTKDCVLWNRNRRLRRWKETPRLKGKWNKEINRWKTLLAHLTIGLPPLYHHPSVSLDLSPLSAIKEWQRAGFRWASYTTGHRDVGEERNSDWREAPARSVWRGRPCLHWSRSFKLRERDSSTTLFGQIDNSNGTASAPLSASRRRFTKWKIERRSSILLAILFFFFYIEVVLYRPKDRRWI